MPKPRSEFDIAFSLLMTTIASLGERLATDGATTLPHPHASRLRRLADLHACADDAATLVAASEVLERRRDLLA